MRATATPSESASAPMKGSHSLEFFNGQILFRSTNGHADQWKFLSPAAVAAAFQKTPIDSGWLPAGVIRCGSTPLGSFAVYFVRPQLTTLEIEGRARPIAVTLPAMVLLGLGSSFYVWSLKQKEFSATAELYRAPLPNVFAEGRICWGANKPPIATAKTIPDAWKLFITSPFSGHAANNKSRSQPNDVRPLLAQLNRSRKPFPAGELVSYHTTLGTYIDQIIGGTES